MTEPNRTADSGRALSLRHARSATVFVLLSLTAAACTSTSAPLDVVTPLADATVLPDSVEAGDIATLVDVHDAATVDTLDTAVLECGAAVASYDRCECDAQCPAGNHCVAPFAGIARYCSPDCAGADGDRCAPYSGASTTCFGHHCGLYCDVAGIIARCATACVRFPPSSPEGFCAPGSNAPPDSGGVADVADVGVVCPPVTNDASEISWTTEMTPLPVGSGGPIMAGHYVLTAAVSHSPPRPPPPTITEALDVDAAGIRFIYRQSAVTPDRRLSFAHAEVAATLVVTPLPCSPATGPVQRVGYTATADSLVIFDPGPVPPNWGVVNDIGAYSVEYTFTRR